MPMSTKRKAPAKLAAPAVKPNAKRASKTTIDETRTAVSTTDAVQSSQIETIEISSDSEDDDEYMSDRGEGEQTSDGAEASKPELSLGLVNGKNPQSDEADDSDAEATSPSFGELLRGNETIDVTAMLQQSAAASNAVTRAARTAIAPPSYQSLTTVLSQALRTDDTDLLESCLHTNDHATIQNTIERIDSALAGTLLNKLATRLHRRPGRAGILMTWVQWTLIAHGNAIASQPKVVSSLNSLQKVLAERSKGLTSLLSLKGKLDLLEGQMTLRKNMQRNSGRIQQQEQEEVEEDVIYVEGEEDDDAQKKGLAANGIRSRRRRGDDDDEGDDDEDDDVVANGFIGDSEDEEEVSDDEDENSDAGEELLDEDEVDYDDVDESMGEEDESDVEVAPPSKLQKVTGSFGKKK